MLWKTVDLVNITHLASKNSYKQNTKFISRYSTFHYMTDDDHRKEKTGAELLSINNMLPVPIRQGIHSQTGGCRKMVQLYQSFVICKLWVHLVAEAVISGAKGDANSDKNFQRTLTSSAWVVVCKKLIHIRKVFNFIFCKTELYSCVALKFMHQDSPVDSHNNCVISLVRLQCQLLLRFHVFSAHLFNL